MPHVSKVIFADIGMWFSSLMLITKNKPHKHAMESNLLAIRISPRKDSKIWNKINLTTRSIF